MSRPTAEERVANLERILGMTNADERPYIVEALNRHAAAEVEAATAELKRERDEARGDAEYACDQRDAAIAAEDGALAEVERLQERVDALLGLLGTARDVINDHGGASHTVLLDALDATLAPEAKKGAP
jgi:hypothetical protein